LDIGYGMMVEGGRGQVEEFGKLDHGIPFWFKLKLKWWG